MPSQAAPLRVLFVDVQFRLTQKPTGSLEEGTATGMLLASAKVAEELVQMAVSYCEMAINLFSIIFYIFSCAVIDR